jgi:hypothetical protein
VADAHEAGGHDVEEKAAEKLLRTEFPHFGEASRRVVGVAKTYEAVADEDQAGIGNRHTVSVATQILEYLFGTAPRGLGIDHPRLAVEMLSQGSPFSLLGQGGTLAGKDQPLLTAQPL